jgi:hypothetical protein
MTGGNFELSVCPSRILTHLHSTVTTCRLSKVAQMSAALVRRVATSASPGREPSFALVHRILLIYCALNSLDMTAAYRSSFRITSSSGFTPIVANDQRVLHNTIALRGSIRVDQGFTYAGMHGHDDRWCARTVTRSLHMVVVEVRIPLCIALSDMSPGNRNRRHVVCGRQSTQSRLRSCKMSSTTKCPDSTKSLVRSVPPGLIRYVRSIFLETPKRRVCTMAHAATPVLKLSDCSTESAALAACKSSSMVRDPSILDTAATRHMKCCPSGDVFATEKYTAITLPASVPFPTTA